MKKKLTIALFIIIHVVFVGCTRKSQDLTKKPLDNNNHQQEVLNTSCGTEINMVKAIKYRYKNQTYCFDSYECLESFKKKPKTFITKNSLIKKSEQPTQIKIVGSFAVGYMLILLTSVIFIGRSNSNKID